MPDFPTQVSRLQFDQHVLPYPAVLLIITRSLVPLAEPPFWIWVIGGAFIDARGQILWTAELVSPAPLDRDIGTISTILDATLRQSSINPHQLRDQVVSSWFPSSPPLLSAHADISIVQSPQSPILSRTWTPAASPAPAPGCSSKSTTTPATSPWLLSSAHRSSETYLCIQNQAALPRGIGTQCLTSAAVTG